MLFNNNYTKKLRNLTKFIEFDDKYDFFVLCSHENPDSDSVSSIIVLDYLLNLFGKPTVCLNSDQIPSNLAMLDYQGVINSYKNGEKIINSEFNSGKKYCLIILDTNDLHLVGQIATSSIIYNASHVMFIDHHLLKQNDENTMDIVSNPDKSSTCEILYDLYKKFKIKFPKEISDAMYAGIMGDTGSFHYPKTNYQTLKIAAELAKNGTVPNEIYLLLYENASIASLLIKKRVFETLQLYNNNHIAVIELTKQMLEETGERYDQTSDLVNLPLSSYDVKVVMFFKENEKGGKKVAIRSKNDIDISVIAQKHGGGGHKNAAGFKISNETNLEQLKQTLLTEISQLL